MTTLYIREATGYREATADDVLNRAHALISQRFRTGTPALTSRERTEEYLRIHFGTRDHEIFGVLHLDTRHRLIAVEDLFRGTLDGAAVYPREVVKSALHYGSAGLILFHNHPSGAATPSPADEQITRRLRDALALIDVRVLDHLIIGDNVYSFAEAGLI